MRVREKRWHLPPAAKILAKVVPGPPRQGDGNVKLEDIASENTAPALRFKGFSPTWSTKAIEDVSFEKLSNGVFNDPSLVGSGYRIINVKDMYANENIDIGSLERVAISEKEFSKNRANFGDIFFTRSSLVKEGIAKSNVLMSRDQDLTYDGHLIRLRPDPLRYAPFFLSKLLKTTTVRRQLVARGKTGTMTTIGQHDIATVKVFCPCLIEQEKIAEFLQAVDKRSLLLQRRHSALVTHKKGVIQRLFSREMRFTRDDGSLFPDWQEKRLGEFAEVVTGSSNREDSTKTGDYVFFDRSTDVRASDRYLHDCEAIIVAGEGTDFPPRYYLGKFDLHQRTYAIIGFGENIAKYLFYWIGKHRWHLLKTSVGSTMPSLRMNSFESFPISCPDPEEQQKIADFLSALDTKIDAVANQIDAIQRFKKGLLQQMFV